MILRRDCYVPPGSPCSWPKHILEGGDLKEPPSPTSPSLEQLEDDNEAMDEDVASPCAHESQPPCLQQVTLFQVPTTNNDATTSTENAESSRDVHMKRADCARASRAARASDPSSSATMQAYNLMYDSFQKIREMGVERAPKEQHGLKSTKTLLASGNKGAAVKTSTESQAKMNHLAALKAKDVDSQNTEPAFLLGGFTTPMMWDRLAENSLKSNAVNSSVLNRKKTQGVFYAHFTHGQR